MVYIDVLAELHGAVMDIVGAEHTTLEDLTLDAKVELGGVGGAIRCTINAVGIQGVANKAGVVYERV